MKRLCNNTNDIVAVFLVIVNRIHQKCARGFPCLTYSDVDDMVYEFDNEIFKEWLEYIDEKDFIEFCDDFKRTTAYDCIIFYLDDALLSIDFPLGYIKFFGSFFGEMMYGNKVKLSFTINSELTDDADYDSDTHFIDYSKFLPESSVIIDSIDNEIKQLNASVTREMEYLYDEE